VYGSDIVIVLLSLSIVKLLKEHPKYINKRSKGNKEVNDGIIGILSCGIHCSLIIYGLSNDLYVTSDPGGIVIWYVTDDVDAGIKSASYLILSPFINTSRYSYVEEDTKVSALGNGTVVPDDVIAEVVIYSTIGLTNGIDSISNNTADADIKSTTEPDTVNEPVMIADPENGNGVVDIPDNCEPSPWNEPENEPDNDISGVP